MSIFLAGYLNSHKDNADDAIDTKILQKFFLKYRGAQNNSPMFQRLIRIGETPCRER